MTNTNNNHSDYDDDTDSDDELGAMIYRSSRTAAKLRAEEAARNIKEDESKPKPTHKRGVHTFDDRYSFFHTADAKHPSAPSVPTSSTLGLSSTTTNATDVESLRKQLVQLQQATKALVEQNQLNNKLKEQLRQRLEIETTATAVSGESSRFLQYQQEMRTRQAFEQQMKQGAQVAARAASMLLESEQTLLQDVKHSHSSNTHDGKQYNTYKGNHPFISSSSSDESTTLPSLATRSSLLANVPTSTILDYIKRKSALPEEETPVNTYHQQQNDMNINVNSQLFSKEEGGNAQIRDRVDISLRQVSMDIPSYLQGKQHVGVGVDMRSPQQLLPPSKLTYLELEDLSHGFKVGDIVMFNACTVPVKIVKMKKCLGKVVLQGQDGWIAVAHEGMIKPCKVNTHKGTSTKGCTSCAVKDGFCTRHSANLAKLKTKTCSQLKRKKPQSSASTTKRARRPCSIDECTNRALKGGVCCRHGAKRNCSQEGCTNHVVNGGVCLRHGAKVKRCSHEGCTKYAQKEGVCVRHGAKVKTRSLAP